MNNEDRVTSLIPPNIVLKNFESIRHLANVFEFAEKNDCMANFLSKLNYLANYANSFKTTRCVLYPDFAKNSFQFVIWALNNENMWETYLVGGLIYQGPDQPLDGSSPAFTVSVSPSKEKHSWSVHT